MPSFIDKWKSGLVKTRDVSFGKIATLLCASQITPDTWDELEAILMQSDIGMATTEDIIRDVKKLVNADGIIKTEEYQDVLRIALVKRLLAPPPVQINHHPTIILVVGVNGSGKTTTIAKLRSTISTSRVSGNVAAADTYRAAAVDQLKVWSDKLKIPVISGQANGDPGAVALTLFRQRSQRRQIS